MSDKNEKCNAMWPFQKHQWLKWSELVVGHAAVKTQFRACNCCGKIQSRSIGSCDQANTGTANEVIAATKEGSQ